MTKEQLKKYRTLKAELIDVEADIKAKTLHDSVQRSKREFPYTFGHSHIVGVADEGVLDEKYDLLIRKSNLKAQIREVDDFVKSIPDYNLKKAVMIYYINEIEDGEDKPTWEDVADEIKNGYNGESIKQSISRLLRKKI